MGLYSSPGSFSIDTVGEPFPPPHATRSSSHKSSGDITRTMPPARMISRKRSMCPYGEPPPPVPRM